MEGFRTLEIRVGPLAASQSPAKIAPLLRLESFLLT